jgi:hypothetical protein
MSKITYACVRSACALAKEWLGRRQGRVLQPSSGGSNPRDRVITAWTSLRCLRRPLAEPVARRAVVQAVERVQLPDSPRWRVVPVCGARTDSGGSSGATPASRRVASVVAREPGSPEARPLKCQQRLKTDPRTIGVVRGSVFTRRRHQEPAQGPSRSKRRGYARPGLVSQHRSDARARAEPNQAGPAL